MTDTDSKPEWAMTKGDIKRQARLQAGKRPRRKWPIVVAVAAAVSIGGYAAVQSQQPSPAVTESVEPASAAAAQVARLARVDVSVVEPVKLERLVKVTGSMRPLRHTTLATQVSGTIEDVAFRSGDRVEAGDVLVTIDTADLQISLDQAKGSLEATRAQLALAENKLETASNLVNRGVSAASTLDAAQSEASALRGNLASLEAQVRAAEQSIVKATIRAPFDGVVSNRQVEPNQVIASGTALMELVDLSRMEIRATAPLSATSSLSPGQKATFTVESDRDRVFEAEVDRINPVAIEGTRSISVFLTLDNADGFLRGGMFAAGNVIVADKANAFALPPAALLEDRQGQYVLKIVGDTTERQAVETGETWAGGNLVEIVSGLETGDQVVNTNLAGLEAGTKVLLAEGN